MAYKIKQFLLNSKKNGRKWQVDESTIDENVKKFVGKPYVINSKFNHPRITQNQKLWREFLIKKGIIDPNTYRYTRKYTPFDLIEAERIYQPNFKVGTIEEITKETSNDGGFDYWANINIEDPIIEKLYKEQKLPPYSSPYIIDTEPNDDFSKPTRNWEAIHLAIVDDPAYTREVAKMKAMCSGDGYACTQQLLTASNADEIDLEYEKTKRYEYCNSSNFLSSNKKNVNMPKDSKKKTSKFASTNKLVGIVGNSSNEFKDNLKKIEKFGALPPNANGGYGGGNQPQQNNGQQNPNQNPNQPNINDVINACVNYMTQNGNMNGDAALQYCQTATEIIVKSLQNGQQNGGNNTNQPNQNPQKTGSMSDGGATDGANAISTEAATETTTETPIGENNKPETVEVKPEQEVKADIIEEKTEEKKKEIKPELDPDGNNEEENQTENIEEEDVDGETLKKSLETFKNNLKNAKDEIKTLRKDVEEKKGEIETLKAELRELKLVNKAKEYELILAKKYSDKEKLSAKSRYYAEKDVSVDDLKELLDIQDEVAKEKEVQKENKKIVVRTASNEEETKEDGGCGCGGKSKNINEEYKGVKLLTASNKVEEETKEKSLRRMINENLSKAYTNN